MKLLVAITRTVVGLLFIFSGLIKANDPLGLSYKMEEFFEAWNFHWFDHVTLAFSILMIVFEIIAGVALLLGWRMRIFNWLLLLLIIFFTFLTGYAWLSGKVRECGCFGNCIPLTAGQSFTKDLILLVLIVFLFSVRNRIEPILPPGLSAAILTSATIFSIVFQWYVLVHLPVVDCMPYKVGTNIPDNMKPPPGSVPDSTVVTMVYEKGGKHLEFDATHFPADFNDSYHFVSRYDKLVRKGNAEPPIKDFSLITGDNTDTTDAVLSAKGFKLFEFVQSVNDYTATREFSIIVTMAKAKNIPFYIITPEYDTVMNRVTQIGAAPNVIVLKCDLTAVRTAARANPTLLLLKKGNIIGKWSYADFDHALPAISMLANNPNP